MEKIEKNIFKFTFGTKVDSDKIWNGHPWSLNGSHLILKRWKMDQAINEISSKESTFILQIYGFPFMFVHEETTKKIGNIIGRVYQGNISKKCVVENRFLRLKIELEVYKPIPTDFFEERANGEDRWIQFKYERIVDFCYKCGALDHVTGKCHYEKTTCITTKSGISTKMFRP